DVVVVALEPLAAQAKERGELVQLVVAAIAHEVRPAAAAPPPDRPVHEDRHRATVAWTPPTDSEDLRGRPRRRLRGAAGVLRCAPSGRRARRRGAGGALPGTGPLLPHRRARRGRPRARGRARGRGGAGDRPRGGAPGGVVPRRRRDAAGAW